MVGEVASPLECAHLAQSALAAATVDHELGRAGLLELIATAGRSEGGVLVHMRSAMWMWASAAAAAVRCSGGCRPVVDREAIARRYPPEHHDVVESAATLVIAAVHDDVDGARLFLEAQSTDKAARLAPVVLALAAGILRETR